MASQQSFGVNLVGLTRLDTAIHPDGFLAKITAPDPDIPKGVTGASWYEIPGVWWNVVERLSWTMLGKPHPGCHFPLVSIDR